MSSITSSMQLLTLSHQFAHIQLASDSSFELDCSAFDALSSTPPVRLEANTLQTLQKARMVNGRRSSISKSHCVSDLSSLAGSSYSSLNSSNLSLSSQQQSSYGESSYGYFVDSIPRWSFELLSDLAFKLLGMYLLHISPVQGNCIDSLPEDRKHVV